LSGRPHREGDFLQDIPSRRPPSDVQGGGGWRGPSARAGERPHAACDSMPTHLARARRVELPTPRGVMHLHARGTPWSREIFHVQCRDARQDSMRGARGRAARGARTRHPGGRRPKGAATADVGGAAAASVESSVVAATEAVAATATAWGFAACGGGGVHS